MKVPDRPRAKPLPTRCAACGEPLWSEDAEFETTTLVMHRNGSRHVAPEALYHPSCAPPPPSSARHPIDDLVDRIDEVLAADK